MEKQYSYIYSGSVNEHLDQYNCNYQGLIMVNQESYHLKNEMELEFTGIQKNIKTTNDDNLCDWLQGL